MNSGFRCCPWPGHFGQSWLQIYICSNETLDFSQPEHSSRFPQVFYHNWDSSALIHTHPFCLCRGSIGNAVCTGWLSQHGIFLSVACLFTFLSLSKVYCQRWGRKIFPFTWYLVPPASNWSLQVSGEYTISAEIPKPVLAYEFRAELASILFV